MSSTLARIALGLSVSGICLSAQAGLTLKLDGWQNPEPSHVTVQVTAPAYSYVDGGAGPFTGTLDGASFQTYCTDLFQDFGFGTTYVDTYTRVDGAAAWGATKAEDLGKLLTYFGGIQPVSKEAGATIQAAVWEILYETDANYSFASGNIRTVGTGATNNPQSALDALDWSAVMATTSSFDVDQLYSRTTQDFLVAAPVPEPSTYALLLGGLGLVGFVARRRGAKVDKA